MDDIIWSVFSDLIATTAMVTLTIYHFMIWLGRRKDIEEKYNLYFAFLYLLFRYLSLFRTSNRVIC
jgi:hypothetical protein